MSNTPKRDGRRDAFAGATCQDAQDMCQYRDPYKASAYVKGFMERVEQLDAEAALADHVADQREAKLDRIMGCVGVEFTFDQQMNLREAFNELLDIIEEQS